MVFDRVVINKLKIIIFVVGIIIGSFSGALVLETIDNTLESFILVDKLLFGMNIRVLIIVSILLSMPSILLNMNLVVLDHTLLLMH